MASEPTEALSLRSKTIEQLRALATKHTSLSDARVAEADRNELISVLSASAQGTGGLSRELRQAAITIKPSFYLMLVSSSQGALPTKRQLARTIRARLVQLNADLSKSSGVPPVKEFRLVSCGLPDDQVIEARLSWQRVIWYWCPETISLRHVYALRFGFFILDMRSQKALFACQTQAERDHLAKLATTAMPSNLTPLMLTSPLLAQIGSFDRVKKASYAIPEPDPDTPANIAYADERLASIPVAREEEASPRSQRQYSFYRIPLGGIVEQGIGVTSSSGKLWIPRETPLETVREYGVELLGKVGRTLSGMSRRGDVDSLLAALNIPSLDRIASIRPAPLRDAVCRLLVEIINMLLEREEERYFTVPPVLATSGVDRYFNRPRLRIVDPDTGEVGYWRASDGESEMIRVKRTRHGFALEGEPSKQQPALSDLEHPLTGKRITISDPVGSLELKPTALLHECLLQAIRHVADHHAKLQHVRSLPFVLAGNMIKLDVSRARGEAWASQLGTELSMTDVEEFSSPCRQPDVTIDPEARKTLNALGEQCAHMTDENCESCLQRRQHVCLRSMVASYFDGSLLLRHKGIERSDMQFTGTIGGRPTRMLGFAKLAEGAGGLTARSKNGAVLLAQLLCQIEKPDFDAAVIVSPSIINEDLRERLWFLCGLVGKKLLVLDAPCLGRILAEYQLRTQFEGRDFDSILAASRRKSTVPSGNP